MPSSVQFLAPDLGGSQQDWLNTTGAIELASLRGRIVILDFWTSCCINCIHTLATLARVETMFNEDVLVIGVHSPKFDAERSRSALISAISRYEINHPVVNDCDFRIWNLFQVRSWPTLVFIGPDGLLLGRMSGEPILDQLCQFIRETLAYFGQLGVRRPKSINLGRPAEAARTLRFPSALKPNPGSDGGGWVLADSGHHQIVCLSAEGKEVARYGSGESGFRDGSACEALFNKPQGLAAWANFIFVADTGNHAIRRINTDNGEVFTLAGTSHRGELLGEPVPGRSTALASPWDLLITQSAILFTNAGTHQLGQYDLVSGLVSRLAGTGAESIDDGPAGLASLAQPSGIALSPDKSKLYFVDSETSALRVLSLDSTPCVMTLIGRGLFEFGHRNGAMTEALLQHPLGLCCFERFIAVADTYNNCVRIVDLDSRTICDLDQGDIMCTDPLCIPISHCAGVFAENLQRLMVVDTDNHRVVRYDMNGRSVYSTWLS